MEESNGAGDSFAAFLTHLSFIRDHHRKVGHIAFVTDSKLGTLAEHVGSHFVSAKIKSFSFHKLDEAQRWILSSVD